MSRAGFGKSIARRMLLALPANVRSVAARRFARLPVARPVTDPEWAYDVAHFERFYARPDPWDMRSREDESVKFALTLELLGMRSFARALEIGCGEGLFTSLLAPRCEQLLAVDISSRAIERARRRCAGFPNVSFRAVALPMGFPEGPFDLILASDVLYYWRPTDLLAATSRIEQSLAPGGLFASLHYALPVHGVSTGLAVHDTLRDHLALAHVHGEAREIGAGRPYQIDVWVKPPRSGRSSGATDGGAVAAV